MKNIKYIVSILVCIYCIGGQFIFSQAGVNPSDSLYTDIQTWEVAGIISNLPPLRPYPPVLIRTILEKVIASNTMPYMQHAKSHYERIFGKSWYIGLDASGGLDISPDNELDNQIKGITFFSGDSEFFKNAFISYDINFIISNKEPHKEILPLYTSSASDMVNDPAEFGSFRIFFTGNASASYGTDSLYVQAGVNRNSFGPFYTDSVVLNPSAFHAGNVSFVINRDVWNFNASFHVLAASNNVGTTTYPNKFMAMHSIEFRPFDWLSLMYYENIVFGDRFDFIYFLPAPYMISQGLGGFNDNLQMGLVLKVRPVKGVVWNTDLLVDDVSANQLLKLNFDTRIRIALQSGVTWAPRNTLFSLVNVSYTLVAPYMYTHSQYYEDITNGGNMFVAGGGVNYQNYTNKASSLGSPLPPNSDQVKMALQIRPMDKLIINFSTLFARHANVNENLSDEDAKWYLAAGKDAFVTDGSIFNYPNAGNGYLESAWTKFLFMEQETKQYTWQVALDASYEFPKTPIGIFSTSLSYTFEYIRNDGVARNMFPGKGSGNKPATKLEADAITNAEVQVARDAWKAQLRDTVNNYIFLSVKLLY